MAKNRNLVLSTVFKPTTDEVISYICYLNGSVKRINTEEALDNLSINLSNSEESIELSQGFKSFDISNYRMWYRRGNFSYLFPIDLRPYDEKFVNYLIGEWDIIKYYINYQHTVLGDYYKEKYSNKLVDLKLNKNDSYIRYQRDLPYLVLHISSATPKLRQ